MGRGIIVRRSTDPLTFEFAYDDATTGQPLASAPGSVLVYLLHDQGDGTYYNFDFADHTFKAGVPTTATLTAVRQVVNGLNTGLWTGMIAVINLGAMVVGDVYEWVAVGPAGASFPVQREKFQWGGGDGDSAALIAAVLAGVTAPDTAAVPSTPLPGVQGGKLTFTASGTGLHAIDSHAYDGATLRWKSGALTTQRQKVTTHLYDIGTQKHTFTLPQFTRLPVQGDVFEVF